MNELTLSYSLADQSFERSKSLGILNLSVQLAEALARSEQFERLTLLSNSSHASRMKLPAPVDVRNFDHAADSGWGRLAWDQWQCYSAAEHSRNEWLFLPKGFSSCVRKPPVKLAVYVHDAMHDFYARRFPHALPLTERWYFARSFAATLRFADIIFTNTEFTRTEVQRLAERSGLPEPRTVVAGIGFDARQAALSGHKADRIVALVGRWPHKRSDLAMAWLREWQKRTDFRGEIHLVGALPPTSAMPRHERWHHHLRPDDRDYHELLGSARAVVYFSEHEGFGMPPVEATLAGACPVFSDLPPTREVMRDVGQRFSNDSFESFSRAISSALSVSGEAVAQWRDELLRRHAWTDVVERIITGLRESEATVAKPVFARASAAESRGRALVPQVIHISGGKHWMARGLATASTGYRAWRKIARRSRPSSRSVLILEPFGLGDVISHEPMIRVLQANGYDVTVCARREWRALFPTVRWVNADVAWGRHAKSEKYMFAAYVSPAFRQFLREIRAAGRGAVGIDTRGDIRSVLLLYGAGCRKVITLSCYLGTDLAVSRASAEVVDFSSRNRRWESNLRCLRPLGLHINERQGPFFPHLRSARVEPDRCIGLVPIAPWEGKWWQPEKWQELAASLRARGWQVRGLCGPGQSEIAREQLGPGVPMVECGSVLDWSEQLQNLAAVVALDSGPMHLTDALGVPVIALFGQGLLPLWAPSGPASAVVTHQAEPDFRVCAPTEENTENARQWMRRIEVSEVLDALECALDQRGIAPSEIIAAPVP
jgi:ADP-heptose:LPS heptosyltransferase/glycosyltransferase involved in cell wall biosynthesis